MHVLVYCCDAHMYLVCWVQTSSNNVQEIIESKVEKRTKGEGGRLPAKCA